MVRARTVLVVAMLFVAACSSDDAEASSSSSIASAVDTESNGDVIETEAESTTTVTFTPVTAVAVETPFSLPPLDTDEIDVMIDEAFEDDQVDESEIAAILETAGLAPETAACEAKLLIELGVEDVGGGLELQQAVESMTPEQAEELDTCLGR